MLMEQSRDCSSRDARPQQFGWSVLVTGALVALAVLAVGGYMLGWDWTGFRGNTLWDWLQLPILPLALTAATALFSSGRQWTAAWTGLVIVMAAAPAVLAVGGYVLGWRWTGFQGNTLWDWLKLLLLPLIVTGSTIHLSRSRPRGLSPLLRDRPTQVNPPLAPATGQSVARAAE
jgi:hypothetical protein